MKPVTSNTGLVKCDTIFTFHFLLRTSPICLIYSIVRVCIATAAPHKFPEALSAADVPYVLPEKISRIFDLPTRCQFNQDLLMESYQKARSFSKTKTNTLSCETIQLFDIVLTINVGETD